MIVVIDTNVLLKMAATGIRSPLFTSWQARQFDLYLSVEMLAELEEVLSRPKIQKFVPPTVGKQFLRLVVERAVFVPMAHTFPHSRDSGDDKVVATAVAAKADYLITVDKDLYDDATLVPSLAEQGIQVVQPGRFQTLLRR
ncbi:MAG TPA: putative toxin-antitoxin system toxin component, PIN family [Chloroflexota bacterium]|nr:putative toxin-antitoxin system toxin component, PIN family [Chloroflexota bacterium]